MIVATLPSHRQLRADVADTTGPKGTTASIDGLPLAIELAASDVRQMTSDVVGVARPDPHSSPGRSPPEGSTDRR
jgi:hypothetical protein